MIAVVLLIFPAMHTATLTHYNPWDGLMSLRTIRVWASKHLLEIKKYNEDVTIISYWISSNVLKFSKISGIEIEAYSLIQFFTVFEKLFNSVQLYCFWNGY